MTKFQFVVSNGARERPSAGTRSHAVRSGLQRKNNPGTSSGSENSQLTIRQRSTLKGRFRISSTPAKTSKTSEDDKEKDSDSRVVGEGSIDLRSRPAAEPEIESHVDTNTGDIANELEHVPREANTGSWGLVKSPSQGWNDPFNAFTVPQNPEVDKLMKFCRYLESCLQLDVLTSQSSPASISKSPFRMSRNNGGVTPSRILC